jgi:hypothetical protein
VCRTVGSGEAGGGPDGGAAGSTGGDAEAGIAIGREVAPAAQGGGAVEHERER